MAITVPNAASIYTACGAVPNSANRWANFGFTATPGGSGCAMFFSGSLQSDADASPLLPIVAASGGQTFISPLFNSPVGVSVASVVGGSAFVWLKTAS